MRQFATTSDAVYVVATLAIITVRIGSASYLPLLNKLHQDLETNELIDGTSDDLTFSEGKGGRFTQHELSNQRWVKITKHPEPVMNAVLGQNIVLTCEVMGSPPPAIIWFKINNAGEEIMTKSEMKIKPTENIGWEGSAQVVSKYVIDCVGPEDEGSYFCAPTLGGQIFKSNPTELKVTGHTPYRCDALSKPVAVLSYSTGFAIIGSIVRLPCRSNKPHQVEWFDNYDERIVTSTKKQIMSDGDLLINNLQWDDMGVFTCKIRSDSTSVESISTFLYPVKNEP